MYERCAHGAVAKTALPTCCQSSELKVAVKPVAISNMLAERPVCLAVSWQRISQSSSVIERTRFSSRGFINTSISLAFHPSIWASNSLVCEFRPVCSPFWF